jgi:queuine tRNA-ribosyltransferase
LAEPHLPAHKARYAMGLGTPAQMVELIARGVDMFDCVLPTRVARNGTAVHAARRVRHQGRQLQGGFPADRGRLRMFRLPHFTRAYLRHLLNANEILGLRMVSVHNSHMYLKVMADARAASRRRDVRGVLPRIHRQLQAVAKTWTRGRRKRRDDF